jgi:large subunit ribosomal protein L29
MPMNAKAATKAKAEDLSAKTPDELRKLLVETRKAQFNQRFQVTAGTLENVAEIRKTRRQVARIKTFLNQKEAKAATKKTATPKPAATKKAKAPTTAAKPKKAASEAKKKAKAAPKKRATKTAAKKKAK